MAAQTDGMRTLWLRLFLFGFLGLWATAGLAAEVPADNNTCQESIEEIKEESSITRHTVRAAGTELTYDATAGTIVLKKEDGTALAQFFYVSYVNTENTDHSVRPVTFCFNGGPGASSVWLHLGGMGPKRIALDAQGRPGPPPYRLEDNPYTLLAATDLVFIDPVSTGYSRAASGKKPERFHGVREDIESVGNFIRLYLTRYGRWDSPKFLMGESYGTTRAAGLTRYLQDRYGIYLNGVILISPVLDFQTISFDHANDLPYLLFLPSYAATGRYHDTLAENPGQGLKPFLEAVESFAMEDYTVALTKGASLSEDDHQRVVDALSRYTGISAEEIERLNLRIPMGTFAEKVISPLGRIVGRFDSRLTGIDASPADERYSYDPSYEAIQGAFSATIHAYLRKDLSFESDLPYEILAPHRVQPWDYGRFKNRYVTMSERLARAMTEMPHLRVFAACGYYDLATPYLAARYTFDHMELDPSLRKNVVMKYYEAGHMMYLDQNVLSRLQQELVDFMDDGN